MTAADFSWGTFPPGPIEAQVRAERDAALAELSAAHAAELSAAHAALADVEAEVLKAEARDGRVAACVLRKVLGMGPRWRTAGGRS